MLKKKLFSLAFLGVFSVADVSSAAIEATIGTRFSWTGSGIGARKPRVYAEVPQGTGAVRNVSAKVESYDSGSVTCLWKKKLPPGTYPLILQPRDKKEPAVPLGDLIIVLPVVETVSPAAGSPGDRITVQGRLFSSKKPKVYLEDLTTLARKKCKVLSVQMDPSTGASSLEFVVPKSGFGLHNLIVRNKIGETVFPYRPPGIQGRVVNTSGTPIPDVQVQGSIATTTTGTDGNFTLATNLGKDQIVVFSRDGYVTSSKFVSVYPGSANYVPVTMMAVAPSSPLDVASGGTVSGARGASLTAPANAFVDAQGGPVTGTVQVSLTPYDPALPEEAHAYPGELRGKTLSGSVIPLKTYGVLDVTVRQGGQTLQVAAGKTLNVSVPAPSQGDKPATVQMWHHDPDQGLWIQQSADGTYSAGTDTYNTTVGSGIPLDMPLNCDNPLRPTCIYGVVVDGSGNPVVGARVTAQSADPNDTVGIYSEIDTWIYGNYCMTVEMDSQVLLTVTTRDGTVTERRITAGSGLSESFPADCSQGSCKQIRTIVVGTPDPGEGSADCNISPTDNPFSGTCLRILGELYECFDPQGTCMYRIEFGMGFSYEVVFANGAKITMGEDLLDPFSLKYYGPDPFNEYCGKMTSGGTSVTVELASGKTVTYTMTTTADGGVEVSCGGVPFRLSAEQMDALAGCSGQAGDAGSGTACEPAPGSFLAPCTFNVECDTGLECCGSIWAPQKQCLLSGMCDLVCAENSECGSYGHYFICCSNGFFDQCLPVDACQ